MDQGEVVKNQSGVEIPLRRCSWWIDRTGNVYMSLPNDEAAHFLSMTDGETFYPSAYPKHIWERLGWECLGPVEVDKISEDLAKMDDI